MTLLEVNNLKKIYTTKFGGTQVEAIGECKFFCGVRGICGDHGRIWFWQNDIAKHTGSA